MLETEVIDQMGEEISDILISLGIPVNLQGFHYLKKSIQLAIECPSLMRKVTKELYPQVAATYNVTDTRVERAIRHAILVAYNKNKIVNLNNVFKLDIFSDYDKPTNSELIALIADRLLSKFKYLNQAMDMPQQKQAAL